MQLTPKDIYEAARPHLVKRGMEDLDWDNSDPDAFYIDLAERLNAQFITPLQGLMDKLHSEFKKLRDMDRKIFDEQDKEIASLKALARDYQQVLATIPDVSVWSCDYATFANWSEKAVEIEARTQLLIKKEQ